MLSFIPLLPFVGFLVNAFLGRRLSKAVSGGVACAVMLAAFAVSAVAAWNLLQMPADAPADRGDALRLDCRRRFPSAADASGWIRCRC